MTTTNNSNHHQQQKDHQQQPPPTTTTNKQPPTATSTSNNNHQQQQLPTIATTVRYILQFYIILHLYIISPLMLLHLDLLWCKVDVSVANKIRPIWLLQQRPQVYTDVLEFTSRLENQIIRDDHVLKESIQSVEGFDLSVHLFAWSSTRTVIEVYLRNKNHQDLFRDATKMGLWNSSISWI